LENNFEKWDSHLAQEILSPTYFSVNDLWFGRAWRDSSWARHIWDSCSWGCLGRVRSTWARLHFKIL